jgi:prepilin-type N-terminal cleavage/methylation domain-containing protein
MRWHSKAPQTYRSAFTLIELLIVISLIVVIAGIGFLTVPLFTSQQRASSNASIIVAWLGDAKVQALKQQQATGVRLVLDQTNPTQKFVREMYYVQTPDDFTGAQTGGVLSSAMPYPGPPPQQSLTEPTLLTFTNVDFSGGLDLTNPVDWPVQSGDFLEINGGGLLYQIVSVFPQKNSFTVSRQTTITQATSNWRIIRQPRRITGEDSLTLNGNAVIDLNPGVSQNVPQRVVSGLTYYEILFAPNGGVVGRGTKTSNAIVLWVRDSTQALATDNEPVLISIQARTGFIGTYQVDTTGPDPYSFTRDPRASGM